MGRRGTNLYADVEMCGYEIRVYGDWCLRIDGNNLMGADIVFWPRCYAEDVIMRHDLLCSSYAVLRI